MLIKILKTSTAFMLVIALLVMVYIAQSENYLEVHEDTYENDSIKFIDDEVMSILNDPSKGVDELESAILEKESYTEGMAIKYEVDNVDTFKIALEIKYPEMSELELGRTILMSLGDTEEFIATLPDEKVVEALSYSSVMKTESFYRQTVDGERIEISESDYYTAITNLETSEQVSSDETLMVSDESVALVSTLSSAAHDNTETLDSYVKLTSTAYKTNPSYAATGRNYFTIRGEVEWTKTPFFQGKDVLAIASSGNVDDNYDSFACAYWPNYSSGLYDYAYIDQDSGEGDLLYGSALKIYNPSVYGVAVDVQVGLSQEGPVLEYVYAYYGITTQNDVTCQVAYAHKTLGIGGPSVGIDASATISFSVGIVSSMNEYFGRAFTLYHESYSVLLTSPTNNATFTSSSSAPTFQWSLQHGNTEKFILEIDYLSNGTYMAKTVNSSNSYTLSASDWNKIINNSPFTGSVKQIRWRIKINYTIYTDSEPYCTAWNTFTITGVPLTTQETISISGSARYTEKLINLGSGGYKDFHITFAKSGTKLIQTFGSKDTKIELYSASGTLLTSNDDGGYGLNALLAYYCSANTVYVVRVKFWSSSVYGNTKLAITPAFGARKTDISSITQYEDIYAVEGYTGFTWNTYAQPNYTRVITFKAPSSGNYTFEIESEFDTYVYVIDPRSSSAIVYNVNYNDDSGEDMNPLLTTYLTADVPYLIIYSAFNPSSLSETTDLTLHITKN